MKKQEDTDASGTTVIDLENKNTERDIIDRDWNSRGWHSRNR